MKKISVLVVAVLIVTASMFALGLGTNKAQEKEKALPVAKWEYRVATSARASDDPQQILNKLGEDGWELVSYTPAAQPSGASTFQAVLKRPKR